MNKTLFLLVFFCSFGYGQKIIVTPDGFKNEIDQEKAFVIIKVDGKDPKDLYSKALHYINKVYENPEKVIKGKIENEFIKVNTHVTDFITIKNSFAKVPISTDYTFELSFKEGKVKYEITSIDMYDKSGRFKLTFKGEGAFSGYFIYNTKDELKKPEAKTDLENYFNNKISVLSEYLNSTSPDNW
jgi:hypothetical protein